MLPPGASVALPLYGTICSMASCMRAGCTLFVNSCVQYIGQPLTASLGDSMLLYNTHYIQRAACRPAPPLEASALHWFWQLRLRSCPLDPHGPAVAFVLQIEEVFLLSATFYSFRDLRQKVSRIPFLLHSICEGSMSS